MKNTPKIPIKTNAVISAAISKYFRVTPLTSKDPKFPKLGKGSPKYLGSIPIHLFKIVLNKISIPIVRIATEKTGSPTIGLKKVLSTSKPIRPVKTIPMINASQKGTPRSTARPLIIPAPTTAKAGWAKLSTSVAL